MKPLAPVGGTTAAGASGRNGCPNPRESGSESGGDSGGDSANDSEGAPGDGLGTLIPQAADVSTRYR